MADTPTILIIDHDADVRTSLQQHLQDHSNYQTHSVEDGQSGLLYCQQNLPDLVIYELNNDLNAQATDGFEVLNCLTTEFGELPIIVLSATDHSSDAVKALKLGAIDYLVKPIADMEILELAIKHALKHAHLKRKNREIRERLESTNQQLQNSLQQLKEDEEAGRNLQFQLLPEEKESFAGYEFSRKLWTSLYLSGDFVDYFRIDENHLGFYIADVAGHGVSPAFITVLLKSYMNRYLELYRQQQSNSILNPAKVMSRMNHNVLESKLSKHLTMFYGVIDLSKNQLHYCNAASWRSNIYQWRLLTRPSTIRL